MILRIDMASQVPIYVQLRNEIVRGIARGEFAVGESLPTVRQLAADLGVNTMTVSKAYQALKAEGFLETDRRHGATVCRAGDPNGVFREKLAEELELLIAEAKLKGCPGRSSSPYAPPPSREWRGNHAALYHLFVL